ncbi:hypothetical protein [Streptomyces sp. 891-h]|uniref:hypothetical protein n=1 Tax=Streptomyces sp. 891-h TaxID=2720714 RepID=UPI001FAB021A|nr:hypothetical protein [Streptomyces sp. 891-h]UNZ18783.1 hypothetical protein HC362_18805 [Streptomyces sp. 891-h]
MSDHEEKVTPESGEVTTKDRNNTIKPKKSSKDQSSEAGTFSTQDRNNTIRPAN